MTQTPVSHDIYHRLEQFYFREARLFCNRKFREWFETMVDSDVHYFLPIFERRFRSDPRPEPQLVPAIFDDNHADLNERILQLETNLVWNEDPPATMKYLVTNIEGYENGRQNEIDAYSNFLVSRTIGEREEAIFVGSREDCLRLRADGDLRLTRRTIRLSQRVIGDANFALLM
jgi:3-phenylpropionate/cinnamic acid dioxygenase small subunit